MALESEQQLKILATKPTKKAEGVGLEGFLLKPVNPSMLFDTIMQAFGEAFGSRAKQRTVKYRITNIE